MTNSRSPLAISFLAGSDPQLFAHRGAPKVETENSFDAFEIVNDLGLRYVETDVRTTLDGVAVVIHDSNLSRLFDVGSKVSDTSWRDLKNLANAHGVSLLTLQEALERFPLLYFNLDLKDWSSVRSVGALLTSMPDDSLKRICIASFSELRVLAARRTLGARVSYGAGIGLAVPLVILSFIWVPSVLGRICDCLQIPLTIWGASLLTRRNINKLHWAGIAVHFWTLNDERRIKLALTLGADGVMSDDAELLAAFQNGLR